MTLSQIIREISGDFNKSGIPTPLLDAQAIISHVLGMEIYELNLSRDRVLEEGELAKISRLVRRRLAFEPVAYIVGTREFYSLPFHVNRRVLIPRPETELVVDMVIYYAGREARVLDLGTGSGAIAVAVKHSRRDLRVSASDISAEALTVARRNAREILGKGSINFHEGSFFAPFKGERFDVIASNPPYVNPQDAPGLQKELSFEPPSAIFSGEKGRGAMKRIIRDGASHLVPGGIMILEIGHDMRDFILETAGERGYGASVMNDYAGLPRIAILRR